METCVYLSDERILNLFFDRNESAITETDRKYGRYLMTVAVAILKNDADGEECKSDTYLRTWRSIPPARPQAFLSYLTKILRGIAINRWHEGRREKRIPVHAVESFEECENILPDGLSVETAMEAKTIGECIASYLRTVSERRRYIFLSRYYTLRSIAAIASTLGVSVSTVKKELQATKRELKKHLEKEGITV